MIFQNLIPQMKKSQTMNRFYKEVNLRKTIYNIINILQLGGTINDSKKTGLPTSWKPARKNYLKRLANNYKEVSQIGLGRKLGV